MLDAGCWMLGAGCWVLDDGRWPNGAFSANDAEGKHRERSEQTSQAAVSKYPQNNNIA
ncbi:MAG: hypothetical protein H6628_10120 [Calditrichae bacterium]|nr:hypothetical protein [Calditrichia bacterium]